MIVEIEKARNFKSKLRSGKVCLGAQLCLCDSTVAEIFGRAGYDWMAVDTEHTSNNPAIVKAMLQAAASTAAVLLARPLHFDPDEIRRFLDLGSQGVLCPFINTGEEADLLVRACRYPPAGIRGYGPRRAGVYGFDAEEYFNQANDAMICIPMIESKAAIDNIEEIVRVDGIDGICIGPMDLTISLGCFRQFECSTFLEAVERAPQACRKYKKAMGQGCPSLEHARKYLALGDTLLFAGEDESFLTAEARRYVHCLRN